MSIFGSDGRVQVTNPADYPFSAIGRMRMRWKGSDGVLGTSDDIEYTASGAMIDSYHFLTAGHCVFDFNGKRGWADSIEIILGSGGKRISYETTHRAENEYYGEAQSVYMRSYKEWTENGNFDYDLGLVTLDRNIGTFTGTFGYGYDDTLSSNTLLNVAGYPTDKFDSDGDKAWDNYDLWRQTGKLSTLRDLTVRSTDFDIIAGNSGGPLWFYQSDPNQRTIYGVVSNETPDSRGNPLYNEFTRINRSRYEDIQRWIQEDNATRRPTDKADLVDYDDWFKTAVAYFSRSVVSSGESLQVRAVVRNNGTAIANNFAVSFYASQDANLSTWSDNIFIGTKTVSALSPFQWTDVIWDGALPAIAQGYYYVGWLIDSGSSVSEFKESNNTGLITSSRLYVSSSRTTASLVQDVPGSAMNGVTRLQLNSIDPSLQELRSVSLGKQPLELV